MPGGNNIVHSIETRQKISKKLTGRKLSLEHIEKIRINSTGANNPNYGKPRSKETKIKIGLANSIKLKGKKHSDLTKQKMGLSHTKIRYILCIENNIIFTSLKEIQNYLNLSYSPTHVEEVCKGKRKSAYKLHWRYLTEEEIKEYKKNGSISRI